MAKNIEVQDLNFERIDITIEESQERGNDEEELVIQSSFKAVDSNGEEIKNYNPETLEERIPLSKMSTGLSSAFNNIKKRMETKAKEREGV